MQPPVRLLVVGIACVGVFAGTAGWFQGSSRHNVASAAESAAPAVSKPPAPSAPKAPAKPVRKHLVQSGDTLWNIAARYKISMDKLLAANPDVDDPGQLWVGQELLLPEDAVPGNGAVVASSAPSPALRGQFVWPVVAPISSNFGPRDGRMHAGIDLAANMSVPIKAARTGRVLLAGEVSGYGQTVVLQHSDGTRTLYAHSSKLLVSAGQQVKQGETIALVGSTGRSTGPHLHFEIIVNDRSQNPLDYLPQP